MIILAQSMEARQNYATQILIALFIYIKTEDFFEDISNDVENGLIHLIMIKMIKELFR